MTLLILLWTFEAGLFAGILAFRREFVYARLLIHRCGGCLHFVSAVQSTLPLQAKPSGIAFHHPGPVTLVVGSLHVMNEFNDRVRGDDAGKSPATANEDRTDSSRQPVLQPERIIATCPHCKSTLRVRRAYIGGVVRCKGCNQEFLVPPPEGTQPAAFSNGSSRFEPTKSDHVGSSSPSDGGAARWGR